MLLGAEGIEGFLQGFVAAVGIESVEPFGRGVDVKEHEPGQQSVYMRIREFKCEMQLFRQSWLMF